ncbi:glycosyltransferase [Cyanobium sp. Aljojuca 7D2]|uniref:glycosyltransferase n=1 Tax=Cyanobium sp. Aljojuca 7D2 TaxID=2823698 RepID=UPI0020CF5C0B|nr:glycosyltransferase [Cyanobium sp. Aljojuca 7D2]MCP9891980.1 glycosyltransferase [Cyanobium sp. Aljojuca 7D2]
MGRQILLIHQGFPGQFKHLIGALRARGDELWAISGPRAKQQIPAGVRYLPYKLERGNGRDTLPLASELETKVIRGEAVATVAAQLADGTVTGAPWQPDLILGHPGWGEMLFLGDVWPEAPQLHYVEFFHGVPGTDNDIADPHATPQTWQEKARARIKNTNLLVNLNQMQAGLTPTRFQHSLLPAWAQARTSVIHDGIDVEWLCSDPAAQLTISPRSELPGGLVLRPGDPVITFVNRTFEPYRGVHVFLEALAQLQARHPTAQAVLVGTDTPKVSYGAHRSDGRGWLTVLREQLGDRLDWRRIHPLGQVPHGVLRDVYRVSAAHVYLSYPFVLSWSLLEAMGCGALVVGSATAPVQELIQHGETGLLVPFGDAEGLANTLLAALQQPARFTPLRQRARQHIQEGYALHACLKRQLQLVDAVAGS